MTFEVQGKTITFCDYTEADFEGFVACINRFYRGGYSRVEYLTRSSLHEKLKTGNLLLTLGKLPDGTVISVSAAERHTGALSGIVELFMRCVAPAFQGRHVGTAHERYLLARIHTRFPDALCLQADSVTYDVKSQTTLLRNGFTCCGLCLMMYDSTKVLSALSCKIGARMTFAVYCKPQSHAPVTLYPPPEHTAMICRLFDRMALPYHLPAAPVALPEKTAYDFMRYDDHKTAEFYIKTPGTDDAAPLFSLLRQLLANGYTVVGHLNLSHPGCVGMYRRLQALGFYFSGIRPLSHNGQYLILAQTANSLCGYDTVFLPAGQEDLLRYIINGGCSS